MDTIPLPESSVVCTLPQAGFSTVAPDVIHADLIPHYMRSAMDQAWALRDIAARPLRLHRLEDVFVAGEGLVFASNLQLYQFSRNAYTDPEIEGYLRDLLSRIARASVPSVQGATVLCKKRGSFNYGHWMVEMLPRMILADRHGLDQDFSFLVYNPGGGMEGAMRRSIELAGIDAGRVRWSGQEPRFFKSLLVFDGLTEHGNYMSPLAVGALEQLRRPLPRAPRPLYISRASARWRRVVNEDEIIPRLRERGFDVCDPGSMSVEAQIAAFQDASAVVGMIGAGLTNLAFCQAGTPVTLFVPASMPDTFFWFLAQHRGLRHREVRLSDGLGEGENGGPAVWDRDMRIPPEFLSLIGG